MKIGPYELDRPHVGDALTLLRELPDESVHCCVTSPPYWGLRSYLPADNPAKAQEMGTEKTPDEFVARLVDVFREVRRALRTTGTCFVVIGDSYANDTKWGGSTGGKHVSDLHGSAGEGNRLKRDTGLKPKDLCLIPARLALALQADGWWVRSWIVWAKGVSFCEHYSGSVMPESVRDRPTAAHETVLLLTKAASYWYDAEAVRETSVSDHDSGNDYARPEQISRGGRGSAAGWTRVGADGKRNLRNVWTVSPKPYKESHYATFPPDLVTPMLKAGCPPKVCSECGAPWVRVVEVTPVAGVSRSRNVGGRNDGYTTPRHGGGIPKSKRVDTGFQPSCPCDTPPRPGVVLDPFIGSGTVGEVAQGLGRHWLGFDLDTRNLALIHKRTRQTSLLGLAP